MRHSRTFAIQLDRTYPGLWTITFSNPPINMFVPTTLPGAPARRAKIRSIVHGVPSDFELSFGRHLPAVGQVGDHDTVTQPG